MDREDLTELGKFLILAAFVMLIVYALSSSFGLFKNGFDNQNSLNVLFFYHIGIASMITVILLKLYIFIRDKLLNHEKHETIFFSEIGKFPF